jgi:hypothetical protein
MRLAESWRYFDADSDFYGRKGRFSASGVGTEVMDEQLTSTDFCGSGLADSQRHHFYIHRRSLSLALAPSYLYLLVDGDGVQLLGNASGDGAIAGSSGDEGGFSCEIQQADRAKGHLGEYSKT